VLVVGDRHTAGGGECSAFGHGLLLYCETLRSRLRDHFSAAIRLLPQRRPLTELRFAKNWRASRCMHLHRNDFGSIAAIASVLR
jgi:hypothetical protein